MIWKLQKSIFVDALLRKRAVNAFGTSDKFWNETVKVVVDASSM